MALGVCLSISWVQADSPVDETAAQEIALTDAGLIESDAQRLSSRYEREDGEEIYDVEFQSDGMDYEYMIREADGMILEWSIEGADVGSAQVELSLESSGEDTDAGTWIAVDGAEIIGIEAAKEIAVKGSGLDTGSAVFTSLKFDYNGQNYDYEIEVGEGAVVYEYTLDAESGEILQFDND